MATRETVSRAMGIISSAYLTRATISNSEINVWEQGLSDISDDILIAATNDIITTGGDHPPSLPQLRRRAVELRIGTVAPISASEAWERCLRLSQGYTVNLSPVEKRALDAIGGIYRIKTSDNIGIDRSAFMRHYDAIYTAEFKRAASRPEIRSVENSRRALPAHTEQRDTGVTPVDTAGQNWSHDVHCETYPPFKMVAQPGRSTISVSRVAPETTSSRSPAHGQMLCSRNTSQGHGFFGSQMQCPRSIERAITRLRFSISITRPLRSAPPRKESRPRIRRSSYRPARRLTSQPQDARLDT